MDAMTRKHKRMSCVNCRFEVLKVNGEEPASGQMLDGDIENISKGGFKFITSQEYKLDDRIIVRLHFADGRSHETLGRICYCNDSEQGRYAYGFSIISGFYSLG